MFFEKVFSLDVTETFLSALILIIMGLEIATVVIMKNVLGLMLILLFSQNLYADVGTTHDVHYVDENDKETSADWDIHYYPVWVKENNEKHLYLQVWLALPPLMDFSVVEGKVDIVENTEKNKSPFLDKKNVKKILRFITRDNVNVIPLKKSNDTEKLVKVKVSFGKNVAFAKEAKECEDLGVKIDSKTTYKPFLISINCENNKLWRITIHSSTEIEILKGELKFYGEAIAVNKNKLIYIIKPPRNKSNQPLALADFFILKVGSDQKEKVLITYNQKKVKNMGTL